MEFRIDFPDFFNRCLEQLDKVVANRVLKRIAILKTSRHIILPVEQCPQEYSGLRKIKVGDWRVFLWCDEKEKFITLFAVWHRSEAYKKLFR